MGTFAGMALHFQNNLCIKLEPFSWLIKHIPAKPRKRFISHIYCCCVTLPARGRGSIFPSPTRKDVICLSKERSLGRGDWAPPVQKLHHKPILNGHLPQTALFVNAAAASVSFYHMETHGGPREAAFKASLFIHHPVWGDLWFFQQHCWGAKVVRDKLAVVLLKGILSFFLCELHWINVA